MDKSRVWYVSIGFIVEMIDNLSRIKKELGASYYTMQYVNRYGDDVIEIRELRSE